VTAISFVQSKRVSGTHIQWLTSGLIQEGQSLGEGAYKPKLRKNIKKWWWITRCRGCAYTRWKNENTPKITKKTTS